MNEKTLWLCQLLSSFSAMEQQLTEEYLQYPDLPEEDFRPAAAANCLRRLRTLRVNLQQNKEFLSDEQQQAPAEVQLPDAGQCHELRTLLNTYQTEADSLRAKRAEAENIEDEDEYARALIALRKQERSLKSEIRLIGSLLQMTEALSEQTAPQLDAQKNAAETQPQNGEEEQQKKPFSLSDSVFRDAEEEAAPSAAKLAQPIHLYCGNASGVFFGDSFLLNAGSKLGALRYATVYKLSKQTLTLRNDRNVVSAYGKTLRQLRFATPALAAEFVLGRPASGLTEWHSADGTALQDVLSRMTEQNTPQPAEQPAVSEAAPAEAPQPEIPAEPEPQSGKVGLEPVSESRTVSNSIFRLAFRQTEPVSEEAAANQFSLYFADAEGQPVSETVTVTADLTALEPEERIIMLRFSMHNCEFRKDTPYYLYITEQESGRVCEKLAYTINIAFLNEFDF